MVLYGVAGVVAVAALAGLLLVLLRPSSEPAGESNANAPASSPTAPPTPSADEQRLLGMLPKGYGADACRPAVPPEGAVAQVDCRKNTDRGGPQSATYTLTDDEAALNRVFDTVMQSAQRVDCPGNIQSPGPWRRNAAPEKVAGTLFCGLDEGRPTVAWTDASRLLVSVTHAGPSGPAFPELYAWWTSHS